MEKTSKMITVVIESERDGERYRQRPTTTSPGPAAFAISDNERIMNHKVG